MDHDKFNRMGGVQKYGYGHKGWARAKEEIEREKRTMLYQKIGIIFLLVSFLGVAILIVTR